MNEYMRKRQQQILDGRPLKVKEKKPIAKKSEKRIQKEKEERERLGSDDSDLVKWFKARQKRMVGHCAETGLKTETKIYRYAINSICHILSQQHCPSVKYHPLNWIELNQDFHVMFDKMSWEEREQLGCWPIIEERLIHVWECLAPEERRFFPPKLREKIENRCSHLRKRPQGSR